VDEWLVQLSDPQDSFGFDYTSKQYREAEIVVPIQSASERDGCLAERDPAMTFWRQAMRWNVLFVAATLLVGTTLPSVAQISVDMNQITCGSFLGYSPDIRNFVRSWMSGYYNAAANSNILDYDRFQKNSAKVATYCRTHKSQTLPTAIKNLALW
jgi:hypothetical protein